MRDVEAIGDGHAAGEFALRFDLYEMFGLRSDDGGIESNGHGDGVGERDAVFAGLFEEGLLGAAVAFDGESRDGCAETDDLLNFFGMEYGLAAAEVPADEFDGESAAHHNAGGFGIAPDVVFGGGSDVAFAAGSATHDDATADLCGDGGFLLQGEGDVGERTESDKDQAGVGVDRVDDGRGSALIFRSAAWRRVAVIAQAITTVKPGRAHVRALEWLLRASEHRDVRIAKLRGIERVARGLKDIDVSCHGGDGQDLNLGRVERHDQGNGIVGSGVSINQKRTIHATQDNKMFGLVLGGFGIPDIRFS